MKGLAENYRRNKRRTERVWTVVVIYSIVAIVVAVATQPSLESIGLFVFRASILPYITITWWAPVTLIASLDFSAEKEYKGFTWGDIIWLIILIVCMALWILYGVVVIKSLLDSL